MKIKGLFLSAIMVAGMFSSLNVQAASGDECLVNALTATTMMMSLTLAPTGTSVMITGSTEGCYGRDIVLNVQEDAIAYRMTGEISPLLEKVVAGAAQKYPQMSEDEIVDSFVNAK